MLIRNMMKNRKARLRVLCCLLCLSLLFFSGCAAHHWAHEMESYKTLLKSSAKQYRIEKLEDEVFDRSGQIDPDADLICMLELGEIYSVLNQFEKSNSVLEAAFERYTKREERAMLSARTSAVTAWDTLFFEGTGEYWMSDYEKIYLNTLKAMNFLMLNDVDAARVEIRRAIDRHQKIRELAELKASSVAAKEIEERNSLKKDLWGGQRNVGVSMHKVDCYFNRGMPPVKNELQDKAGLPPALASEVKTVRNSYENSFTYLLGALTFALENEAYLMRPHLKNAVELTDNAYIENLFAGYEQDSSYPIRQPNVYIFARIGFAPVKNNLTIQIPNPISNTVTQFAIAQIQREPTQIDSIEIVTPDNNVPVYMEKLSELDLLALRQYQDELPLKASKAALRVVSQTIRDRILMEMAAGEGGEQGALLTQILLSLFNVTTTQTDTRTWTLAPKRVSFYCGKIDDFEVQLQIKNKTGDTLSRSKIPINPDGLNIISLRCAGGQIYAYQQCFNKPGRTGPTIVKVVWDNVNIRIGPSTNYKIIDRVSTGAYLKVIQKESDWYRIELPDGRTGYIYGKALDI